MDEMLEDNAQLRDYFAAKAMQGILSRTNRFSPGSVVERAYKIADSMLEERE